MSSTKTNESQSHKYHSILIEHYNPNLKDPQFNSTTKTTRSLTTRWNVDADRIVALYVVASEKPSSYTPTVQMPYERKESNKLITLLSHWSLFAWESWLSNSSSQTDCSWLSLLSLHTIFTLGSLWGKEWETVKVNAKWSNLLQSVYTALCNI